MTKLHVTRDAVKEAALKSKATCEIPIIARAIIVKENSNRKVPIDVTYDYVRKVMMELIKEGLI